MKNKGFTLIELLAVIVILAIISLIATPVILGIIDDSRNSSDEQSVELYGKAVENAVANYMLKHPTESIPEGNYVTTDGKCLKLPGETNCKLEIDYDGSKVECNTININQKGNVYLNECKVNDKDVEYVYGASTLVQYITNLYTPNSTVVNNEITYNIDTVNGIIDDGLGGTISSGGNLRYYGANPDNYIDIGDRDENYNPILWRIIGVFETKYATDTLPCNVDSDSDGHFDNCASDKLVKIIRNDSIGNYSKDYYSYETQAVTYTNYSITPLQIMLNGAYYNSTTTDYYNDSLTPITVDFTNTVLSSNVRNKIENALWYLGDRYNTMYADSLYNLERDTNLYHGGPAEWVGKVGLMYVSDYGYSKDLTKCSGHLQSACADKFWLLKSDFEEYFINATAGTIVYDGTIDFAYPNNFKSAVRPVLYLKSDVSITGEGTTSDGINYKIVG